MFRRILSFHSRLQRVDDVEFVLNSAFWNRERVFDKLSARLQSYVGAGSPRQLRMDNPLFQVH